MGHDFVVLQYLSTAILLKESNTIQVFSVSHEVKTLDLNIYVKLFGVQGILGMQQLVFALCNLCTNKNLGGPQSSPGGPHLFFLVASVQ